MNGFSEEPEANSIYPVGGAAKRTALGSFWTFVGYGIGALEQIIFVPLFLWAWGKAMYGEWLTLFSVVGYFSISDLGMGRYVTNKLIQAYSHGDTKEYARILKSGFGIFSAITAILFVCLIIFACIAPFSQWFHIATVSALSVKFSVLILGTYIILGTLSNFPIAIYTTTGKFPKTQFLMNIRELLLVGFVVLVLVMKGGFVSVASVYLFLLLLFTGVLTVAALRQHREIDLSASRIDWKLGRTFVVPGLIYLMIPLANMIYLQGSILVVSATLGSVAVVTFSVHRTLANLIQKLTGIVNNAISPELTAGEAREEYEKLQLIHHLFSKVVLYISISLSAALLFIGKDLMQLWTGGRIVFDERLWLLFLVFVPVLAFWLFNANFQEATNKYNKLALSRILSTGIGLVLAIILVKPLGLIGVLLGFLIGEVAIDVWYIPHQALQIVKDGKRKFVFSMLGVLPMVALQLMGGWFVSSLFNHAWLKVIAVSLTVTAVGGFYLYYPWFNETERNTVNNFVRKVRAKFIKN